MTENNQTYNIKPADRLSQVAEYYFSRKLKEIDRLNAEGKDIVSLAIGSPDMPPSRQTIDKLCEVARQAGSHGYQPTMGTPELRQAMAGFYKRWYGINIDPQTEIQPLIGSKEGILHITLAFVNTGDKVLVPNPGYPTYTSLSKLLGAEVVTYNLREDDGWQPDFDELEAMDLTGVRLMWTNYPNMPTGTPARMETYRRLVSFARRHNIVVVNDNPYSLILNEKPVSLMQVEGAKDCCIELNDSGTFRGIQLAAAEAYNNSDAWHRQANIDTYRRRRSLAEAIMQELNCEYGRDQVGMFLWGKIPDQFATAEELTEKVLHRARVFITPGFIFGSNGERYVRISLCAKDEKMEEALKRIKEMSND